MDWIDLARDRDQRWGLVKVVMNLSIPENVSKFLSSCTTGDVSRGVQPHVVSQSVN
jgi:hypothetical protein